MADLDNATTGSLRGTVPLNLKIAAVRNQEKVQLTPAERLSEAHTAMQEQRAQQARQNTLWRSFLFWGVSGIVGTIALANVGFIVWYMARNPNADPIVLSTWVAGGAVQVIGLLVVITRHLFPSDIVNSSPSARHR